MYPEENEESWSEILTSLPFKIAVGAVLAVIALFFFVNYSSASSLEDVLKSTQRLNIVGLGSCSGQFVKSSEKGEDIFLTAAHCVDDPNRKYTVEFPKLDDNFDKISNRIEYLSPKRVLKAKDIAVLETKDKSGKYTTVDVATEQEVKDYLKQGAELVAVGYPKGLELTVTRGQFQNRVKSMMPDEITTSLYKTTVPITGGNSGGGLYIVKDGDYKLIGIASMSFRDVDFMSYFSPIENIREILSGLLPVKESKSGEKSELTKEYHKPLDDTLIDQR